MEYSRAGFDVSGEVQGFMVDVGSLYDFLSRLEDRRDARGIRYKLAHILVFVALAKLAGEDRLTGIAEWVRHRKEALAQALGLRHCQAPHRTTYSRIFGEKLDAAEFEEAMGNFLARVPGDGQLVQAAIDGKALRGSIPAGQTQGVHLMAAYLPGERVVLAQVEVEGKENEIKAAPRLVKAIDLRSKVVSGDAMLTQRQLSSQVVESMSGPSRRTSPNCVKILPHSLRAKRFRKEVPENGAAAETVDKGHGRIEKRSLRVSASLNDYLDWPYVQQVFQVERRFEYVKEGKTTHERVYGITSLGMDQAAPPTSAGNRSDPLEYRKWLALPSRRDHAGRLVSFALGTGATDDGGGQQPGPGVVVAARSQQRAATAPSVCCPMGRGPQTHYIRVIRTLHMPCAVGLRSVRRCAASISGIAG